MNKVAIKKFAVESRQKLIKSVIERLEELGITDKEVLELIEQGGVYTVKSLTLNEVEKKNRDIILSKIQEKGYESFVEEIAYTWFNRIIAIRYMEVNDYLPFRTRVLSSEVQGKVDPDIITEIADHIEELELNRDKIIELKEQNKQEDLFKYVFIKVCNYLGQFLPVMFEQIENYTELLLPSVMISNGSVIKDMIELVPEEDWTNQVEIIGWLYQYYISEKKDQVFADLKKNKKITKENIPAATQLFTPEWIVKYMVENSLGRLWLEGHPNEELKSKWKYYLEEAEQEEAVEIELKKLKKRSEILTPEDLTIIDPAMGSGHILIYAFDVLYQIYQSVGYSEREIPRLILEKNIHGLDIDDRAGQLAYFSIIMKARQYNRRILQSKIFPNVYAIRESNLISTNLIEYISERDEEISSDLNTLKSEFYDAKEFGSMLNIGNKNYNKIVNRIMEIKEETNIDAFDLENRDLAVNLVLPLIHQGKIMSKKYRVVITNPPYMGYSRMNMKLQDFLKKNYENAQNDIYAAFIFKCKKMTEEYGIYSMITQHTWMYNNSYREFRKEFLYTEDFKSLIHLGSHAFEELNGEVVQTVSFIATHSLIPNYYGQYIDLSSYMNSKEKELKFLSVLLQENNNLFKASVRDFKKIVDCPIAYWINKDQISILENCLTLNEFGDTKQGIATGKNEKFLRLWHEVNIGDIKFRCNNLEEAKISGLKWFPYNKGGEKKKWYGNNDYVVNWKNDGEEIRNFVDDNGKLKSRPQNIQYFFKSCCTWSLLASGETFVARYKEPGFIFDINGMSYFTDPTLEKYLLAILCSPLSSMFMKIYNPSLANQSGDVAKIPVVIDNNNVDKVTKLVEKAIEITKQDYDSFEESWDFKRHPLL